MGFLGDIGDGFVDGWSSTVNTLSDAYSATLKPILVGGQHLVTGTLNNANKLEDSFVGIAQNLSNPVMMILLIVAGIAVISKLN